MIKNISVNYNKQKIKVKLKRLSPIEYRALVLS
ncbi:IS3 family transposase [Lactobacillus panisapium]